MRRLVQEVSLAHGFTEQEVRRIVLAMDEACSNVIRYAYGGDPTGSIVIEAGPCEDGVCFEVIDWGRKPDPDAIKPRSLEDDLGAELGAHEIRLGETAAQLSASGFGFSGGDSPSASISRSFVPLMNTCCSLPWGHVFAEAIPWHSRQ